MRVHVHKASGGTGMTSLPLHSIAQSKSEIQPTFKGRGKRLHLLMDELLSHISKGGGGELGPFLQTTYRSLGCSGA